MGAKNDRSPFGVTNLSAIQSSGRWDSKYHIALMHNKERVAALLSKHDRDALNGMLSKIGLSKAAWEVICRGRNPSRQWADIIPMTYSDQEVALYIVLATFDDAIQDDLQKLLKEVKNRQEIIEMRKTLAAELGELS